MGLLRNIRKGFMFLHRDQGIAPEDAALIAQYLNDAERVAFCRMDEPDQVHSVRVARLCEEALNGFPQLDEQAVMKAALLHDIGKTGARLGLIFRTFWVLGHKVAPALMDGFGRGGDARRGSLRDRMRIQVEHAAIGADMLKETGTAEEVRDLVRSTGEEFEDEDDMPLQTALLLAADADRVLGPDRESQALP